MKIKIADLALAGVICLGLWSVWAIYAHSVITNEIQSEKLSEKFEDLQKESAENEANFFKEMGINMEGK